MEHYSKVYDVIYAGKRLPSETVMWEGTDISLAACALQCQITDYCRTIDYSESLKSCHLSYRWGYTPDPNYNTYN